MGRDQRPARELARLDRRLEQLAGEPAFDRFDRLDDVTAGRTGKGPAAVKSLDERCDAPGTCGHQAMSARRRMDTKRAPWRISTSSSVANLTGSGR